MQIYCGVFAGTEQPLETMSLRSPLFSLALRSRLRKFPLICCSSETGCNKNSGGNIRHNDNTGIPDFENRGVGRVIARSICDTGTISCSRREDVCKEHTSKNTLRHGARRSSGCRRSLAVAGGTSTNWVKRACDVSSTPARAVISSCNLQLQEDFHSTAKWKRNGCEQRPLGGDRKQLLRQRQQSQSPAHEEHQQKPQQLTAQHQQRSRSAPHKERLRQSQQQHQTQQRAYSAFLVNLAPDVVERTYSNEVPCGVQSLSAIPLLHTPVQRAFHYSQSERGRACTKCHPLLVIRERERAHVDSSLHYNCSSSSSSRLDYRSNASSNNVMPCSYAIRGGRTDTEVRAGEESALWKQSLPMRGGSTSRLSPNCATVNLISYVNKPVVPLPIHIAYRQLDALQTAQEQPNYGGRATVESHCRGASTLLSLRVDQPPQEKIRRSEDVKKVLSQHFTQLKADQQEERQDVIRRAQRICEKKDWSEMLPLPQDEGSWNWLRYITRECSSVSHKKQSNAENGDRAQQRKQVTTEEQHHPSLTQLQGHQPAEVPISTLTVEIADRVGSLCDLLVIFRKFNVNITQIKSTPKPLDLSKMTFSICFQGKWEEPRVAQLLDNLQTFCSDVKRGHAKGVPWFPRCVEDLDKIACQTLDAGADLQADHPGFHDKKYRMRRQEIASLAETHRTGNPLKHVDYTDDEKKTWEHVWMTLTRLYPTCACAEFNAVFRDLRAAGLYRADELPQMAHINDYVHSRTGHVLHHFNFWHGRRDAPAVLMSCLGCLSRMPAGHFSAVSTLLASFTFRPVAGLLAARDFLNALAFRVFFSTQYIRHSSVPLYTPEPDVIHELLGHAPLLANPEFAEFSQLIGLASLGASEEEIQKLQRCYWFSVEFGLLLEPENNALRAYGAGLLSSPGELLHATSPTNTRIQVLRWRPEAAAAQTFPVTTFQPVLFAAQSLEDVREQLLRFCHTNLNRPFAVRFDRDRRCVHVSTEVNSKPISLQF